MSIQQYIAKTANNTLAAAFVTLLKDIDEQNDGPVPQVVRVDMMRCEHPEHPVHAKLAGPWGVIMTQMDQDENLEVDLMLSLEATLQAAMDATELPIAVRIGRLNEIQGLFPEATQTSPVLELMEAINADHPITEWFRENAPDARVIAAVMDDTLAAQAQQPAPQTAPQPTHDDRPWPGQYL